LDELSKGSPDLNGSLSKLLLSAIKMLDDEVSKIKEKAVWLQLNFVVLCRLMPIG